MLKVSLFRGSRKNQEILVKNMPQKVPRKRWLLWVAVIHDEDETPTVRHPKVMLYQEAEDRDCYWIRKENSNGVEERPNYSETNYDDALTAISGFESSLRVMVDRLGERPMLAKHALTLVPSVE